MAKLEPQRLRPGQIIFAAARLSRHFSERLSIRVGTIEGVEDVAGSEKLLRLIVDFGNHKRNILAGIKMERQTPKEIEGKQALFVVNLKPRRMMGEISEGMLFEIDYADGLVPVLSVPEKEVPNGTRCE